MRLATIVLKPGHRQLLPSRPSFSSLIHMTSSPCTLFQSGTLNRCSCEIESSVDSFYSMGNSSVQIYEIQGSIIKGVTEKQNYGYVIVIVYTSFEFTSL